MVAEGVPGDGGPFPQGLDVRGGEDGWRRDGELRSRGVVEARGDAGVGSPRRGWRRGEMSRRPRMERPVVAVAMD